MSFCCIPCCSTPQSHRSPLIDPQDGRSVSPESVRSIDDVIHGLAQNSLTQGTPPARSGSPADIGGNLQSDNESLGSPFDSAFLFTPLERSPINFAQESVQTPKDASAISGVPTETVRSEEPKLQSMPQNAEQGNKTPARLDSLPAWDRAEGVLAKRYWGILDRDEQKAISPETVLYVAHISPFIKV